MASTFKKVAWLLPLWLAYQPVAHAEDISLLNVSYDPTRELYQQYNHAFSQWYRQQSGDQVSIRQSHGGSGTQARSIIEGAPADVATLALAYDIDAIAERGHKLVAPDWQRALPDRSSPYTSTIVFLVRKGNPKHIKDWDDLIKPDISVITPNPKTSGGARWNYLAAWGYGVKQSLGDLKALHDPARKADVVKAQADAQAFVTQLFKHVPVLDSGARGATNTFVQRGLGDVLIAWENEAFLALKESGGKDYEIVTPSISILTEPPVALVYGNVERKGPKAEQAAKAYLEHLYSPEGQRIVAENFYRPRRIEGVPKALLDQFPNFQLTTIDDFGGWQAAQKTHFANGGTFDQIYKR